MLAYLGKRLEGSDHTSSRAMPPVSLKGPGILIAYVRRVIVQAQSHNCVCSNTKREPVMPYHSIITLENNRFLYASPICQRLHYDFSKI